jgi:hypothetical protein
MHSAPVPEILQTAVTVDTRASFFYGRIIFFSQSPRQVPLESPPARKKWHDRCLLTANSVLDVGRGIGDMAAATEAAQCEAAKRRTLTLRGNNVHQ